MCSRSWEYGRFQYHQKLRTQKWSCGLWKIQTWRSWHLGVGDIRQTAFLKKQRLFDHFLCLRADFGVSWGVWRAFWRAWRQLWAFKEAKLGYMTQFLGYVTQFLGHTEAWVRSWWLQFGSRGTFLDPFGVHLGSILRSFWWLWGKWWIFENVCFT